MINDICIGLIYAFALISIISWGLFPLLVSKSIKDISESLDEINKSIKNFGDKENE